MNEAATLYEVPTDEVNFEVLVDELQLTEENWIANDSNV